MSGTAIHNYIPEFVEEFYEKDNEGNSDHNRNYIIKAYVFGDYLDTHVSLERGDFEFQKESDVLFGISQTDIESLAANIAKNAVGDDITARQDKKRDRVNTYVVDEAPWHQDIVSKIDLSKMVYNPSNEQIEARLQKEKFRQEAQIRSDVTTLLAKSSFDDLKKSVPDIVAKFQEPAKMILFTILLCERISWIYSRRAWNWTQTANTIQKASSMTLFFRAEVIVT